MLCVLDGLGAAGQAAVVVAPVLACALLLWARPAWGLAALLCLRAAADAVGAASVGAVPLRLNLAACLGLLAMGAACLRFRHVAARDLRRLWPFAVLLGTVSVGGAVGAATLGLSHVPVAAREIMRLAALPACGVFALSLPDAASRRVVRRAVAAIVWGCAAWGCVQVVWGRGVLEATSGVRRATGPFAYPNMLGYVLLLGIVCAACRAIRTGSRRSWIAAAAFTASLALTASFSVFALLV